MVLIAGTGKLLAALVIMTAIVPPLGMAFGADSMAAGLLLVALAWMLAWSLGGAVRWRDHTRMLPLVGVIALFGWIALQGTTAWWIFDGFDFTRYWQSCVLLAVCIAAAVAFSQFLSEQCSMHVHSALRSAFYVLLACGIFGLFRYSPFYGGAKALLFFSEPSHFALSFLPFFFYMSITNTLGKRLLWVLLAFLLALGLQNLTLMVGVWLVAAIVVPVRIIVLVAPVALVGLLVVDGSYYLQRMNLMDGSQSLSVLVFQQGWERAYLNLLESFGMGVGFQQFGIVGEEGRIPGAIQALYQKLTGSIDTISLNVLDGGSVAPKLIGEFGVIGCGAVLMYLAGFVRSAWHLRRKLSRNALAFEPRKTFLTVCFIGYSVELLVRGVGYFSPSGFLFLASLLYMTSHKMQGDAEGYVTRHAVLQQATLPAAKEQWSDANDRQ